MDKEQLIKAFTATVQASLHGLQSLQSLLQHEQAALTGKDPEVLQQIVQKKVDLLKQLEPSVKARDRLQRAAGLTAGLDGGSRIVETLAHDALRDEWAAMVQAARTVADLNDRNAQLVQQGQRATRAALGILTGRQTQDDTYSTLRRKGGGVASYSLAKA